MRVISGSARGRRLLTPRGMDIRPTADKVKESMFSILGGMIPPLEGAAVLDIFAGTGNLGIEALSRGAARAVFIDSGRESAAIIRKNLELTGFRESGELIGRDFRTALSALETRADSFSLVFIDPPYRKGLLEACLERLGESRILEEHAIVVAEHSSREEIAGEFGPLCKCDHRVYGDTALSFFTKIRN